MDKIEFQEGCMWCTGIVGHPPTWEVQFDRECHGGDLNPCKHCHSEKTVMREALRPWEQCVWICPRVVVAWNGERSTGICLDCILEIGSTVPASR